MGRTEAKSGQAAKRPMAETSGASLPRDVSVLSMLADLEGRDLDGLRRQWRAHLGGEAPAHLPRWLIMRVLAYELQSNAFGDLDKSIRRNPSLREDDGAGVPFDAQSGNRCPRRVREPIPSPGSDRRWLSARRSRLIISATLLPSRGAAVGARRPTSSRVTPFFASGRSRGCDASPGSIASCRRSSTAIAFNPAAVNLSATLRPVSASRGCATRSGRPDCSGTGWARAATAARGGTLAALWPRPVASDAHRNGCP